jgi:hypothetical protein
MLLIVDLHERRSGLASELRLLGVTVEEQRLVAGDYLLPGRALIERKTVPDLHGAVLRGRFWAQISKLRQSPCWPYLLVEGRSIYDGPLPAEAVRGLILAVSDLGVTVIRSDDARDSPTGSGESLPDGPTHRAETGRCMRNGRNATSTTRRPSAHWPLPRKSRRRPHGRC